MNRKPPAPVCLAFLVCDRITRNPKNGAIVLVGHPNSWQNDVFPAEMPGAFFARLSGGHGDYTIEVQLQNSEGEVIGRAVGPEVSMPFPLERHDLTLDFCPTFPAPADYYFTLSANGEEIASQAFNVRSCA